jgi:GAF domain-containing protein
LIHYWNAGVRLGFFLIVTLLLSALRQSSHRDHRRRLALEAVNEVAHSILSGRPTDEVVRLITGHARALLGAALAIVATPEVSGKLVVCAVDGVHAEELEGRVFDEDDSPSAEAMRTRSQVTLADAAADPRTHVPLVRVRDIGPAVFVPLTVAGHCFGTLSIGRLRGGRHFSEDDLMLVQAFANEAGVALEYGEIRSDLERLAVLEERQHIAKDLYEWVGQSLFAVGMLLRAADAREDGPATRRRLTEAVDEIDRMIAELRGYILDLSPSLPVSTTPELP